MAQSSRLDTIANNLANVNTNSFKKDRQVFSEYLSTLERPSDANSVPKMPASIESFYDMQGTDNAYVNPAGTYTNFEQGGLRPTGGQMDVALDGKGFFQVQTPQGQRFTRNGAFQIDNNGTLCTREGWPVMTEAGGTVQVQSHNVTISQTGEVFDGGASKGKLAISTFDNLDELQKVGNSNYQLKGNAQGQPKPSNAKVQQGFLEASNVNVVEEMTDMISANRVFEATQKAIKGHDQMDEKLISVVGKV